MPSEWPSFRSTGFELGSAANGHRVDDFFISATPFRLEMDRSGRYEPSRPRQACYASAKAARQLRGNKMHGFRWLSSLRFIAKVKQSIPSNALNSALSLQKDSVTAEACLPERKVLTRNTLIYISVRIPSDIAYVTNFRKYKSKKSTQCTFGSHQTQHAVYYSNYTVEHDRNWT